VITLSDLARLYPDLLSVRVTLVESKHILGAFDKRLQAYAEKKIAERDNFILVKSIVVGMCVCMYVSFHL
jgi:NADH dehydrogenase FAD-containing subunit